MSLPSGWIETSLDSLGSWQGGSTPSKSVQSFWNRGTIPWVSPKDMKRLVIEDSQDRITTRATQQTSIKIVPAGSILIVTRSGILQHSLPVAVTATDVTINQDLKALVPHKGVDPFFVALQLRAKSRDILAATAKAGTTVDSLDFARLRNFAVWLAPHEEQLRIVEKVRSLLNRADKVGDELALIATLATRYRKAASIRAFEGRLIGTALAPQEVELRSLLSEGPTNGWSPPTSAGARGALSLRLTATTSGSLRLDSTAVKRVNAKPPKSSKYWLRPGDLLVQRANSLEHVGASAIYDGEEQKYIYPDLMIRIRIADPLTREYVWRYLNSPQARNYFQLNATGSAGNMPKITGPILASLRVPMFPPSDMARIVNRLRAISERLDAVEAERKKCEQLNTRLESSLLLRAFRGATVKQDPTAASAQSILDKAKEASKGAHHRLAMTRSKEVIVEDTKGYLERRLTAWPDDGLSFEELLADAPGEYDDLKDGIFEMLASTKLAQTFDLKSRRMKFRAAG